ncbi:hypothetical protein CSUI_004573 [Cystoisospora suis]|uniref:Uncharacterized protein n=1 Tax=Cystoisospora suis TaxID=483139 RepID=A0A2C6KM79_9APIC|nr:hypothetical protein CSUI_004573 [Cystoisospora suis]
MPPKEKNRFEKIDNLPSFPSSLWSLTTPCIVLVSARSFRKPTARIILKVCVGDRVEERRRDGEDDLRGDEEGEEVENESEKSDEVAVEEEREDPRDRGERDDSSLIDSLEVCNPRDVRHNRKLSAYASAPVATVTLGRGEEEEENKEDEEVVGDTRDDRTVGASFGVVGRDSFLFSRKGEEEFAPLQGEDEEESRTPSSSSLSLQLLGVDKEEEEEGTSLSAT